MHDRRRELLEGGRRAGLALLAVLLMLVPLALSPASAADDRVVDPTCGTPLGAEIEDASAHAVETDGVLEHMGVDAVRMTGAQRSPEVMLSAWGHLVLVAEVKVDEVSSSNFTWAIFARIHSNTTGWSTTPLWLSSPNTSQYYPVGAHIRPSAVFWHDRVWVVWDAQGSTLGGPVDRFIVMRSFDRNLTADTTRIASASDPNATTQHAALIVAGDVLALAYSTSDGDSAPGDAHIAVRTFDGFNFAPAVAVSNLSDGWGDALPALASDGAGRLFAAWNTANATGESSHLTFAWAEGGAWRTPAALAELGNVGATNPAAAFFGGRAYFAYSTSNLPDLSGTDSEVRWFVFDASSGSVAGPVTVNPEPTGGDDSVPTLTVIAGGLAVGWSTTEDFAYSHSSDTDPVYRVFNGSGFGPVFELSNDGDNATDGSPFFVELGGALYAHWMLTPPQQPGDPRGNSREIVRLVSRPPAWYDGLVVDYAFAEVAENGSARIILLPHGLPFSGHDLAVRLPDGSVYPFASDAAWVPVNPSAPDFEVLACGLPVQARPVHGDPGPPPPSPLLYVAFAVTIAAAAVIWWRIGRRLRGPKAP